MLHGQTDSSYKGIKWIEGLTWAQLLERAKAEDKYIFVDAYATWCGPCKQMDRNVYTDEKVSFEVNQKFISVKVQMDTSVSDNENVKRWYGDANAIKKKYPITGFPTFLFLSPDGHLVHSALGYKNVNEFINLANYASDPKKQFYTLIEDYKAGKKNYTRIPYMIVAAKEIGEIEWEKILARDYIENVLYKKKQHELFNKENVYMIGEHLQSSNEKGFKFLYRNQQKINSLLGKKTYAQSRIEKVIYTEEITPRLNLSNTSNVDPDWDLIRANITQKYGGEFSNRIVLSGQLNWYNYKKNWLALAKYNIEKIEKYGLDTAGIAKTFTNNMIWKVYFMHCNDIEQLKKAAKWMQVIVTADPYDAGNIDTYANLLYKSGYVSEAIKWEEIATKLWPDNKELQMAIGNMKNGEPTYVKQGAVWNEETLQKLVKRMTPNKSIN
jgi:thioredoxin-related protein